MSRIDLVPPIKGIDRSMPLRAQADLTCPDAQNVRDFAPLNQAQTVGKRSGIAKAFSTPSGDGAGTPITGICVSARSNEIATATSGVFQAVSDAWRVYAKPTAFQGFFYGLDLRGEYVRFGRRDADYASRQLVGTGGPNQEGVAVITGGGLPDLAQFEGNSFIGPIGSIGPSCGPSTGWPSMSPTIEPDLPVKAKSRPRLAGANVPGPKPNSRL